MLGSRQVGRQISIAVLTVVGLAGIILATFITPQLPAYYPAAGMVLLAGLLLAHRSVFARQDGLLDAFDTLHGQDKQPAVLVSREGRLVYRNAAAKATYPGAVAIADIFGPGDDDVAAWIYRASNMATENGSCRKSLRRPGVSFSVSIQQHPGGLQAWHIATTDMLLESEDSVDPPRQTGDLPPASSPPMEIPFDDLPVAFVRLANDGRIQFANLGAQRLLGISGNEDHYISDLLEGLAKPIPDRLAETLTGKAQGRSEVARGLNQDGFLQVTMSRIQRGDDYSIIAVLSDATELKTLEAQFVQSQKMQAVGQLAGGIAHDFNNLLTAINGHCDLLLLRHVQGDGDHSDLMQIRQNANRAASLVRQLLAFSRKQNLRPQVLHLFDTLAELANLLDRLLGEKVELRINNTEDIWPVRVDERQLEQVVVNLVVNARDAMPDGGVVSLSTRKVELTEALERDRATVAPGRYSLIEVQDTGIGIPEDKVSKIFEPFFTTKKVGEGTGLGLSTAYGIIKQMDGFIFVDSKPGEGATFTIYLPAFEGSVDELQPAERTPERKPEFKDPTGKGIVLLVEDEAPVRAFAARALQLRGYTVLEAESGEAALEVLEDDDLHVDLFVSDVIMPGMDGPTWVLKAYEKRPQTSTVFVSGYSEDAFENGRPAIPRSSYLAKPFTLNDLSARVREHLDTYAPDADT